MDQHETDCLEGWIKEISPYCKKVRCKLIFVLSVCTSNTNNWLKPCSYIFTCRETLQFWRHINRWKNEISSHLKQVNCSSTTLSAQVTPLTSGNNSVEERDGSCVTLINRNSISSFWDLARKYVTAQGGYLEHCLIP